MSYYGVPPIIHPSEQGYSTGDMIGTVMLTLAVAFVAGVLLDRFVFSKKGSKWAMRSCVDNPKAIEGSVVKVADKGAVQFCGLVGKDAKFEICDVSGDSYVVQCAKGGKLDKGSDDVYTCDADKLTKAAWFGKDGDKYVCYNMVPDPVPTPPKPEPEPAPTPAADQPKAGAPPMSALMNIWRARHMLI